MSKDAGSGIDSHEKELMEESRNEENAEQLNNKTEKFQNSSTLLGRTGGAYIPPARLAMMQKEIADKSSDAYQRISWEALKKSINGLINKV